MFCCYIAIWPPETATAALGLMCIAGTTSFFVTFFVCGLFGGFDRHALAELVAAGQMPTLLRPLCTVLVRTAQFGARLSPMKRPRELDFADAARAEAEALDDAAQAAVARAEPGSPLPT